MDLYVFDVSPKCPIEEIKTAPFLGRVWVDDTICRS